MVPCQVVLWKVVPWNQATTYQRDVAIAKSKGCGEPPKKLKKKLGGLDLCWTFWWKNLWLDEFVSQLLEYEIFSPKTLRVPMVPLEVAKWPEVFPWSPYRRFRLKSCSILPMTDPCVSTYMKSQNLRWIFVGKLQKYMDPIWVRMKIIPWFTRFYTSQVVTVAGFLNHQKYSAQWSYLLRPECPPSGWNLKIPLASSR